MRHFVIPYVVCTKILVTRYSTPRRGASYPQPLDVVPWPPKGAQDVVPLDLVPPEGGATLGRIDTICSTWNANRGTRCSMPPKGAATLCHIDTRCSMLGYPQNLPRRGCDILSHTRCSMLHGQGTTSHSAPKGCDNLTH